MIWTNTLQGWFGPYEALFLGIAWVFSSFLLFPQGIQARALEAEMAGVGVGSSDEAPKRWAECVCLKMSCLFQSWVLCVLLTQFILRHILSKDWRRWSECGPLQEALKKPKPFPALFRGGVKTVTCIPSHQQRIQEVVFVHPKQENSDLHRGANPLRRTFPARCHSGRSVLRRLLAAKGEEMSMTHKGSPQVSDVLHLNLIA